MLAQALAPKAPSARTSVPTSRKAAHTMAFAPPGKVFSFSPGLGFENLQIKNARMNCEARNEMPASAMVSDICSSIGAPCVEMSSAIHQVCRRMGIAETIAITMMVTANIRAMVPHVGAFGFGRDSSTSPPPHDGGLDVCAYFALKVKSAFAACPPATVTFAVCVPRSSCHAVTV